jgi:energy-coupling factor transporter ATP-binding protein EcfA2
MDSSPPHTPPAGEPDFAAFDLLVDALGRWASSAPAWAPARRVASEWGEVAPRLDKARRELSRVLVVGVVGGTGTGKSTLVNALAGAEVTAAGDVARPTTVHPVVIAARDVDVSWLPLEAMQARLVRSEAAAVGSIVLVDCPDPDTQAAVDAPGDPARPSAANHNRDLLEAVLPACDVLLLVSTAQKYRSWIVARELAAFAPGRPLLFVQTHASRDPDIRDDWRKELESQGFDVPRIFRLDGVEAAARSAAGLEPEPGFRDLVAAIDVEFSGRAARRVRRTGALDLAAWFTRGARSDLAPTVAPVAALAAGVDIERRRLEGILSRSIGETLRGNRSAWQRLIGDDVVARWHGGPFAGFLHVLSAVGSIWNRVRPGTGVVGRLLAGQSAPAAAGMAAGEPSRSSVCRQARWSSRGACSRVSPPVRASMIRSSVEPGSTTRRWPQRRPQWSIARGGGSPPASNASWRTGGTASVGPPFIGSSKLSSPRCSSRCSCGLAGTSFTATSGKESPCRASGFWKRRSCG